MGRSTGIFSYFLSHTIRAFSPSCPLVPFKPKWTDILTTLALSSPINLPLPICLLLLQLSKKPLQQLLLPQLTERQARPAPPSRPFPSRLRARAHDAKLAGPRDDENDGKKDTGPVFPRHQALRRASTYWSVSEPASEQKQPSKWASPPEISSAGRSRRSRRAPQRHDPFHFSSRKRKFTKLPQQLGFLWLIGMIRTLYAAQCRLEVCLYDTPFQATQARSSGMA